MEYPFTHHHHRRDDDEDDHRHHHHLGPDGGDRHGHSYPPPGVDHVYDPPRPWFPENPVHHVSHDPGQGYAPPPFDGAAFDAPPPPPYAGAPPVQHVSHEMSYGSGSYGGAFSWEEGRHHHHPGYAENVSDEGWDGGALNRQPTVRIFTKAEEDFSLSIRDGKVILARKDPQDMYQHWIKDLKYSTKIKDEEGFPAFALVNKASGEALKHSFGPTKPVRLVPYNPNFPDESVLWSESNDLGDGFRCIRMVNNIRLNFDAFHGDEDHGGVHDGTILVLWEWLKGKNQRWKIVPY
ncbi:hypothetical protein HPP92_013835, partial [Vanilla planifolia]